MKLINSKYNYIKRKTKIILQLLLQLLIHDPGDPYDPEKFTNPPSNLKH